LSPSILILLRRRYIYRLHVPDRVRILLDAAIAAEEPHTAHADDALANPLIMIFIRLIHQRVRLDVAIKIVTHEIIISLLSDRVTQRNEAFGVAESSGFDDIKNLRQIGVEGEGAEFMGVTKVFDVLGQVTEKEDIRFPNLPGDFNLTLTSIYAQPMIRAREADSRWRRHRSQ
jgi:hypothetical protein